MCIPRTSGADAHFAAGTRCCEPNARVRGRRPRPRRPLLVHYAAVDDETDPVSIAPRKRARYMYLDVSDVYLMCIPKCILDWFGMRVKYMQMSSYESRYMYSLEM